MLENCSANEIRLYPRRLVGNSEIEAEEHVS